MNAILRFIILSVFTLVFVYAFVPSSAFAQDSGAPALELYPEDASDACVADSLQIRVRVIGVKKQGIMKLELYNAEDGFLSKSGRLRSIRDAAQEVTFDVGPTGADIDFILVDLKARKKEKEARKKENG